MCCCEKIGFPKERPKSLGSEKWNELSPWVVDDPREEKSVLEGFAMEKDVGNGEEDGNKEDK